MRTKTVFPSILFLGVVVMALVALSAPVSEDLRDNRSNDRLTDENEIVLYYGEECPHCAIVDEYIDSHNISEHVSFTQKEVYHNRENADELARATQICGLSTNEIGVPFLWTGQDCLLGSPDIIEFFEQKVIDNQND